MNTRLLLAGSVRIVLRQKLRCFFMGFGIVTGVAAFVVVRSLGTGAEADLMGKLNRMLGASGIVIVNGAGATRGGPSRLGKLTMDDLRAIGERLDQVVDWDPSLVIGSREVQYRDRNRDLRIFGHSERAKEVWSRGVVTGEYFSKADVASTARVALLGSKTAEALFGGEDPIGRQIRIGGSPFRVIGVLEGQGVDPHGWDRDDEVHVPISTMMRRLVNVERVGSAKVIVTGPDRVAETVEQIAGILRERHGLSDDEEDDFSIFTPTQVQRSVRKASRVLTVYLPATAGIALLVAAVVIANIMLIGVRERVAEIGLRKAVGATSRQVGAQFLLESLAVTATSGALGAVLGAAVLDTAAGLLGQPADLSPGAILMGFGAALVVGVLAGWLPARRAALLEPVDALR